MASKEDPGRQITPEEGRESIHSTLDRSRSSMYVAGWPNIMLLWGGIVTIGYLSQYLVQTLAPGFAGNYPWFPGPLWGGLGLVGMVGSSLIGYRASKDNATGRTATGVGLRVFFFWMTVVTAAFVIPAASGMWTSDWPAASAIPGVAIGIVALGYILFGIMHHPAISLVGVGLAAAYYIPSLLAGDAFLVVSAMLMLLVVAVAWVWIRRSGEAWAKSQ